MVADVETYFSLLNNYRNGDADPFVLYLAKSSLRAAEAAREEAASPFVRDDPEIGERIQVLRDAHARPRPLLVARHPVDARQLAARRSARLPQS